MGSLREKLATAYKISDVNCVHVFGMKTAFGGGRSTGFALMYDNLAAAKKFEPKHRLKRVGLSYRRRLAVATAKISVIDRRSCVERLRGRQPPPHESRTTAAAQRSELDRPRVRLTQ